MEKETLRTLYCRYWKY